MFTKFKNIVDSVSGNSKEIIKENNASAAPKVQQSCSGNCDNLEKHIINIQNIIDSIEVTDQEDLTRLIKSINAYLDKNPDINNIDTKVLNTEIYIKGYAFSKNKGKQQLIKKQYTPMCRSKTKPLEDAITNTNNCMDGLQYKLKQMEYNLEDNTFKIQKLTKQQEIVEDSFKDITKLEQRIDLLEEENKSLREDLDSFVGLIKEIKKQMQQQMQLQQMQQQTQFPQQMQTQTNTTFGNKWKVNF